MTCDTLHDCILRNAFLVIFANVIYPFSNLFANYTSIVILYIDPIMLLNKDLLEFPVILCPLPSNYAEKFKSFN